MKVHFALGDATSDAIVQNVLDIARSIWPEGTAEFESWVNTQLANYGISWAKYQAQQQAASFSATLSQYSTLFWIGGAGLLIWALRK